MEKAGNKLYLSRGGLSGMNLDEISVYMMGGGGWRRWGTNDFILPLKVKGESRRVIEL